jgi:diguanylate cyclase (GGDEF)-like protein/PAS domain S-box-containing protein
LRWPELGGALSAPLPEIPPDALKAGSGVEIRRGVIDGLERIYSYRRVPDFPLYATVGQSLDSLLADFYRGRLFYVSAGAFGSLVVLLLGLMMLSSLRRGEHVESELIDSERRFRSLTELSSDMYWEQDEQYRFTSSSGSGPGWLVKSRDEALGKRRWDFKYDNMSEADWAAHIALLDAHKPFHDLELSRSLQSGRKVWVSVSGEPMFDASGAFKGYRGVGKAITERKRAEQLQSLEHAVSRSLADADSVTAAVQAAVRAICETEGWECGRYFRWDDKAHVLRFSDGWGIADDVVQRFVAKSSELSYAAGVGLAGKVWQSRQPLWATDITQDTRVDQVALARGIGMRGAFVFPVISDGSVIGVLAFNSREIREPEERLMQAISVIGTQIGQFLQRKRREEELRRFRTAMDASEDMIWLLDPVNMKVIDINDTACRKLGYSREELLSLAPQDVISISREELSRIYSRLIEGGEGDTAVGGWYRRKDGSRFPVEAFRRAVQSEGSYVIVAVVRDVTQRRAAEEELRRFRLAMDNSADMIVLIDRATMRFVDVNETACKLLGYSREELLRMGPQDVLPVGREELERSYDELIAHPGGGTEVFATGMKSHYVCKDGSLLPFESTRHVLRSEDSTLIAAISRDIRARLAIEEKVSYLAQFDALTGLPNRNLFQDRLTQAMALAKRNAWPMAVLFIDLDRFKLVNDTLGHAAGDKLLKEAAERLRSCIRASDTVGRLGGDEFAAILSELAKPGDAGLVAQKIVDAFKRPFDLEAKQTYVTASVGVTLYPADSDNAEALVVNADAAMYRAKEQGRDNYQYFTRDMNERAVQRVQMEIALRRALERGEFRLFYQPKADLGTGRICGFEALLRWEHPDKGMVLPGEFIPVLEETGLIVQAGEWVLRTACAQIKAWQAAGLKVPPISVNLSARQFEQKNLKGAVGQILSDAKVDPSLIEFEITESLLMNDPEGAARTLHDLKDSGVKLSMDDFGTGYSSLGYLKRFPIDTLKIDRTFVRDISTDADDATLTRAIINLAQNLRLNVVAEGVETEAQLAFLCLNGCDEMQGYLFARPTTAEECGRMLTEGRKLAIPRAGRKEKNGARRAQV